MKQKAISGINVKPAELVEESKIKKPKFNPKHFNFALRKIQRG
jgi:hypothetical protein